jgi:hypothetical protein
MRRNNHLIRAKKAVKFDNKWARWCNYLNMHEMYEEIYKNLCTNGLAAAYPEPLLRNEKGEVVEEEEKAFGMKSKYELIHPDWLLFKDEVRSNTSQSKMGVSEGKLTSAALTEGLNYMHQQRMLISLSSVLPLQTENLS